MADKLRDLIYHHPRRLAGALGYSVTIGAEATAFEVLRISNACSIRVRAKVSAAATLRVALLRHDQSSEVANPVPRSLALVADTEGMLEFAGLVGEDYCLVEITAGAAASNVTFVEVSQSAQVLAAYDTEPFSVAIATPVVVDLLGRTGFVGFLDGGTATYQACDSEGTPAAGSSPVAVVSGTPVATPWRYVLITATTAACIVSVV